jgi:hypothetical protein
MIDIKIPIGIMFSVLGILLTIYGLATLSDSTIYAKAFNINVNLWSGIFMLIFGGVMVLISDLVRKPKDDKK